MNLLLETLLSILLQLILFGLVYYFFPTNKSQYQTQKTLDQLTQEFKNFYLLSSLLIFLLLFALGTAFTLIASAVAKHFSPSFDNALIVITPDTWAWVISGGLFAFGAGYKISIWLTKKYLKNRFNDFMVYSNIVAGADTTRLMRFISALLIAVSLFLAIQITDFYTVLYEDRIEVDYFFSFTKKVYKYSDVIKIQEIEGDETTYFKITFSDGKVWNSNQNGFGNWEKDIDVIDLIEDKINATKVLDSEDLWEWD